MTRLADGRPVAITTAYGDEQVLVWDTSGNRIASCTAHIRGASEIATTRLNGQAVAITTSDSVAVVWDVETGEGIDAFTDHTAPISAIATTTLDRRPVAITTSRSETIVWDVESRKPIHTFTAFMTEARDIAAATLPNKQAVAVTTSKDQQRVNVWDVATGALRCAFTEHTAPVSAVAVTRLADEQAVAVTSDIHGRAFVWDVRTGSHVRTLTRYTGRIPGHPGMVYAVATTRLTDGRAVAIATEDLIVWDLETGQLLQPELDLPGASRTVAATADGLIVGYDDSDIAFMTWNFSS